MLVNPHEPNSPEWKQWQYTKAMQAAQRVAENDRANVAELQDLAFGKLGQTLTKMESTLGQVQLLGRPIRDIKYAAEGGAIEDDMMMSEAPVGDMSLLVPDPPIEEEGITDSTIGYLDGLRDILGEEDYMQLESAMIDYPVVETVARMAVVTQDGEVEGLGGPTDDMVPARLSPGEFVFSKEAVDVIGVGALEAMHEEAKQEAAMQGI